MHYLTRLMFYLERDVVNTRQSVSQCSKTVAGNTGVSLLEIGLHVSLNVSDSVVLLRKCICPQKKFALKI